MLDINRIKSETLRKLTAEEIGELDLLNHGVMTYKGDLKKCKRGYRTEFIGDWQVNFIYTTYVVEFTKIAPSGKTDKPEWAMRIRDRALHEGQHDTYRTMVHPLDGIDFFR